MRFYWVVMLLVSLVVLAGCGSAPQDAGAAGFESPTIAPFFARMGTPPAPSTPEDASAGSTPPTIAPLFRAEAATPRPTRTRRPPATGGAPTRSTTGYAEESVYADKLAAGWSIEHSAGVKVDLADATHAFEGSTAISITPVEDFGSLFLTLSAGAAQSYPRDQVLGVSFQLNPGAGTITARDLAVAIVGSNALKYYSPDDKSVSQDASTFFSETRLYYLDVNRSITPETWIEIVVWLDKLPYDPNYANVTGVYIKNDAGFRQTFYIDKVLLILRPKGATATPGGA